MPRSELRTVSPRMVDAATEAAEVGTTDDAALERSVAATLADWLRADERLLRPREWGQCTFSASFTARSQLAASVAKPTAAPGSASGSNWICGIAPLPPAVVDT